MSDTIARVRMPCDPASLLAAWNSVRKKGTAAGVDGMTVGAFASDAEHRIRILASLLQERRYAPKPLRRVTIPKEDGGVRTLGIPCVVDRIAQRAALDAMEPALESHFLSSSYAYRTGRSLRQAVQRVSAIHGTGCEWVIHVDVKDCFDSIDWRDLMSRLRPFAEPYLRLLIRKWVTAPGVGYDWWEPVRGIPQGGVISPALCNLVLTDFDAAMHDAGIPEVRYADDCLLFARSEREARATLLAAADALRAIRLEPNREKSGITTFDTGFKFLGTLFVRSVVLPCVRIKSDEGRVSYASGYPGSKRRRKVRVYRGRGTINVEGSLPQKELERLAAKALLDEIEGRSTSLGRALAQAWRKEISRSAGRREPRVSPESVALI